MTKKFNIERNWLYNQYHNLQKTSLEIAKEIGCCQRTILNHMEKFEIKRRTKIILNKKELETLYSNNNLTVQEIAEHFNVSRWTIQRRAREYGLLMRARSFSPKEGNYRWKGDETKYKGIHKWLRENYKPPEKCQFCQKLSTNLELASKTGIHRRDIDNYYWLCHKCHMNFDNATEINKKKYFENISINLDNHDPNSEIMEFTTTKINSKF